MEPVTMMIGGLFTKLAGEAGTIIIRRMLSQDRGGDGRGKKEGLRYDPRTGVEKVPTQGRHFSSDVMLHPTVTLRGDFIPDSRALGCDLLGDEVALLLIQEVGPRSTGQISLFCFDLAGGYEVDLRPGLFAIYAIVIAPDFVSLRDAEVLAVGYPYNLDEADDP